MVILPLQADVSIGLGGFGFCGSVRAHRSISLSTNPNPTLIFDVNLQTKLGVLGQLGVVGTIVPTCFSVTGSLTSGVGGTMIGNIISALKDAIAGLVAQGNLLVKGCTSSACSSAHV